MERYVGERKLLMSKEVSTRIVKTIWLQGRGSGFRVGLYWSYSEHEAINFSTIGHHWASMQTKVHAYDEQRGLLDW